MNVKERLREIDEVAKRRMDLGTREQAKRTAGSRRDRYERAIREVYDVAGREAATALVEWIQEYVRERGRFPEARDVRRQGRAICRERGHEVSTSDWPGA